MGWTKDVIIREAFGEIGLSAATFNVGPDELNSALMRLEAMISTWNAKGIRLGYALASEADGAELSQDSGLPDDANETVICNLAIRLAPQYGKNISPDTRTTAVAGYNTLMARAAMPPEARFPDTMPRGSGSKPWRWSYGNPFITPPEEQILAGGDGAIEFN